MGQTLLQIGSDIKNWGKRYYKLGQLLQIGAIITNWGLTTYPTNLEIGFENFRIDHFNSTCIHMQLATSS